jgi:hypothetical protein
MMYARAMTIGMMAVALAAPACSRSAPDATTEAAREADELMKKRIDDTAELEKRVVDLERRWNEMQAEIKADDRSPAATLRAEVKEDVANVRAAVDNLKTTTDVNWWERHEQATSRTIEDVEADVQRFAKGGPAPAPTTDRAVATAGFELRRDDFITRARARVDGMEERLENVKAAGARETELEDTRARIDKLQSDLDRVRSVSAGDWWEISAERVEEYIDRVEQSIDRLNDDKR